MVLKRVTGFVGYNIHLQRKLHSDELYNLYSSPSIIKMIKSRRRWAGHVA
jgi:hypothetical protein